MAARTAESTAKLQIVSGYTRITLTPSLTRVSISDAHRKHRNALVAAALAIREILASQGGLKRRLTGEPSVRSDGTFEVVLTNRSSQRTYAFTFSSAEVAMLLRRNSSPSCSAGAGIRTPRRRSNSSPETPRHRPSPKAENSELPRVYESGEVAARLHVSKYWLEKMARKRLIPHLRSGRKLQFTADQVHEIIRMNIVLPITSMPRQQPQHSQPEASPAKPTTRTLAARPARQRKQT